MRKIIICTFLTLDGVMQKPSSDDEVGAAIAGWHESCDAMLLGRKTYEIFASHWPTADPDNPVEWQNSTLLEGDVVDAVRELKASDGRDTNVVGQRRPRPEPHAARARRRVPADRPSGDHRHRQAAVRRRRDPHRAGAGQRLDAEGGHRRRRLPAERCRRRRVRAWLREAGGEPGDRRGPPRCAARGRRPGRGGGGSAGPAQAHRDAVKVGEGFGQAEVSLAEGAGRLRGCGPVTSSG